MEDLRWQDHGYLQHTSKSSPCKVECQGQLATKWWGQGVHHIEVYGIHCMQLVWCWHDPGQLGWSSLGRDVGIHRERQHITSSSSVDLDVKLGCSLTAGTCRQLYHCICFITPWGMDNVYHNLSGWVSPTVSQSTALMNSLSHVGASSVLTCTISAFLPFPQCQWQGVFSTPSDLVDCWLAVPELWHFACQWPFSEQPLQIAFLTGQLSWPGGCEWVQLGHCEVDFCGLFFWGWQPWQRAWMALPGHSSRLNSIIHTTNLQ